MPKKQTSKRLDDLFEGLQDEKSTASSRVGKKPDSQTPEKIIAASQPAPIRMPAKTSGGRSTRALPSQESAALTQRGGEGTPSSLSLGFQMDNRNWATLQVVDEATSRSWDPDEQLLVKQVVDQLSQALENARLFQETQSRAEELTVLNEMGRELTTLFNIERIADAIYKHTSRLMDVTNFFVILFDDRSRQVMPLYVVSNRERINLPSHTLGNGLVDYVLRSRQPLFIPENLVDRTDSLGIDISEVEQANAAKCWLGAPLLVGNTVLGMVGVQNLDSPNVFTERHRDLLIAISSQAAIAIQNARLFEETRQRTKELDALNKVVSKSTQSLDLKTVLGEVLAEVLSALHFDAGLVTIFNKKRNRLEQAARLNFPGDVPADPAEGLDGSLSEAVFLGKKTIVSRDLRENSPADAAQQIAAGLNGYLGIPLLLKGEAIGTLCVYRKSTDPIPEDTVSLGHSIGTQIGFAIENSRLFETTQQSEADLRALFASMQDVVMVVDRETRYLRIAPTNPSRLFRPAEDLLGKRMDEILPEETHNPFRNAIARTLEGEEGIQIEYKLPLEGQDYWFLANLSRLNDDEVFWVARDITTRKKAEEDLLKFKLGIDQTTDAVFITDKYGIIVYANPGFERIYGYSQDEAIGQNPRIIKSGLMTSEGYKQFWDALLNKQTVTLEIVNKTKDGRLVSIAGSYSPIIDEGGEILGFLAVHHDITSIKQTEEIIKRRNEYLSATAEIGRLVTSTLDMDTLFSRTVNLVRERFGFYHAAIFITEETGFRTILQAATGIAGADMLLQKHSLEVGSKSIVGEVAESGRAVVVNDTSASDTHKFNPLLPETRAEAAIPLHVGSRTIGALDIQSTAPNAFSDDDIAVLQTLADQVAIAIDNARSYELSMQAVKEMREADRLKSQFLANMSHELRTPLNSIIGFSRVILKGIDGPTTDLQQQDLLAIHNSGQHLLGLINDILDLSRIEAGKMELTFDEVNLAELIASVMSTASGLVKDKPISLIRNIPNDLPSVKADAMRIRQVLLNLLSNAAKFTDEGTITVQAEVLENSSGIPDVRVSVVDTGPGISEEDQKKLFQPFSQVDASPTRKSGGSGLGLSISNHLIQMHGGRMGVNSEPGGGSVFFFTLPAFRDRVDSEVIEGERLILAIDADPQIVGMYERYLQPHGYKVIALNEPGHAVERVRQWKPYAVTLDVMMPDYDGWRILDNLKASPDTCDVPVIVCSINEDQQKGFSLGAADYLVKPILEDDLVNALARLKK